ncbi:hypothetical protein C1646_709692 [Rhizophagus diaphanus]|nr:hypothetical protein C1646_709692 [Rhizophagus diaphanus] [Rhizophagus sp. MUCL 43196]
MDWKGRNYRRGFIAGIASVGVFLGLLRGLYMFTILGAVLWPFYVLLVGIFVYLVER